jgi:hypothetical protein
LASDDVEHGEVVIERGAACEGGVGGVREKGGEKMGAKEEIRNREGRGGDGAESTAGVDLAILA